MKIYMLARIQHETDSKDIIVSSIGRSRTKYETHGKVANKMQQENKFIKENPM